MSKRHILGITWDELPAIGINSLTNLDFAYPRGEIFTKTNLMKWLKEVTGEQAEVSEKRTIKQTEKRADLTIQKYFLNHLTELTSREHFERVVLVEDADSVVFFYSTTNINYYQRWESFQINMAAEALSNIPRVMGLVNFYSYDVT